MVEVKAEGVELLRQVEEGMGMLEENHDPSSHW